MIAPLLDTCIVCSQRAYKPGAGICWYHEVQALIDLSFDRMREALHGDIPVIGKRLQPSQPGQFQHPGSVADTKV
jgi:hypothetical protein